MRSILGTAGYASAIVVATMAAVVAGTALLPHHEVVWLVQPLLGIDLTELPSPSFGLNSRVGMVLFASLGVVLSILVVFYRVHCVAFQPAWSLWLGWAMVAAGPLVDIGQLLTNGALTVMIDIGDWLWPVGFLELMVGFAVVLMSAWMAPHRFSPVPSRLSMVLLVAVVAAAGLVAGNPRGYVLVGWAVVVAMAFVALGAWARTHRHPDSVSSITVSRRT